MTTYSFVDESGETRLRGTIDPAPGGASLLTAATVPLSSAQLLALDMTPVQIVATPGSGKALIPTVLVFRSHAGSVAYTNRATSDIEISWNNGTACPFEALGPDLLDTGADIIQMYQYNTTTFQANLDRVADLPIVIENDGTALADGNGSVDVTLYYVTLTL